MKKKIIAIVKYSKFLYLIYYYVFSFILLVLRLFVKTDDKLILFNSFGGKKYDDSPKELYEAILKDKRFVGFKYVWAFHEPEKFKIKGADVVKTDTLKYFIIALKARCWITNSGIERGLKFKGKNTLYFNTWHGTPIKRMGTDVSETNKSFGTRGGAEIDVMCSQGDFETDVFSRVFNIPKNRFLCCGLPRNDKLVHFTEDEKEAIKKRLGIPKEKIVILYAPTFREYERDGSKNCVMAPPMVFSKWKKVLGEEYCLLFRAHYEVAKVMDISEDGFVFNMSNYPVMDDLMIVSDVLISDYSSVFFDFSVMDKPMLHFTYDYGKYSKNRGMYFDIREQLDGGSDEDTVIDILRNKKMDITKTIAFRNKYVNYYGNATKMAIDYIIRKIGD